MKITIWLIIVVIGFAIGFGLGANTKLYTVTAQGEWRLYRTNKLTGKTWEKVLRNGERFWVEVGEPQNP
jgi:hypothetical protein